MAAKGRPTGKGRPAKGIKGRMPVKRSINLVLVNENKINPLKAALGIIIILALAGAFGKFLVYDRIAEASRATGRVAELQRTLDATMAAVTGYGDLEAKYAHYTYDDMTADETSRVDRSRIVNLISDIIRRQDNLFDMKVYTPRLRQLVDELADSGNPYYGLADFRAGVSTLGMEVAAYREQVLSWSVEGNVLQVELTGKSLENLNKLARQVEEDPIVDSCTLTTANKDAQTMRLTGLNSGVRGKFLIYLVQPVVEEEVAEG